MTKNIQSKNEFTIKGRALSQFQSKSGKTFVTVLVTEVVDKPTFPKVILQKGVELPEGMQLPCNVSVKGYVEGYDLKMPDGKMKHFQNLIATEIGPGMTELESVFGSGGGVYERSKFRCYLTAELVRTIDISDEWAKLIVRTSPSDETSTTNYLTLSFNKRFSHYGFSKLTPGEFYNIYARINTPKKTVNGKTQSFNDLVVRDISVAE